MEGKFKNSIIKYISCLFFFVTGSFLAIIFATLGIAAIQINISSAIFCFGFSVFGVFWGLFSILLFQFNRNAYLVVDKNTINARFVLGNELHTDISNVNMVEVQGKNLKLIICDKIIWIYYLQNAKELCEHILTRITVTHKIINIEESKINLNKYKKSYISNLVCVFVSSLFLFLNIVWCVFLTDGKDLSDFSKTDDYVFVAFAFAELFTLLASFFFANKGGKKLEQIKQCKHNILSATAYEHKYDDLDKYPNLINKKFFNDYTYRVVVFSPKESIFAYMLERFDIKASSWIMCYERVTGFELLSEVYDDIDISFSDVILVD